MKKICALLLLVAIFDSCKDDDPKLTVEQYLTAASNGWVFESIIAVNPTNGQTVDLVKDPDAFEQCELDDAIIFTADGKYTVATNTKCDPSDPATKDTGTWGLENNKTKIVVVSATDGPVVTLTNLSVDDTNIKGETTNFAGFPIAATITMKKK